MDIARSVAFSIQGTIEYYLQEMFDGLDEASGGNADIHEYIALELRRVNLLDDWLAYIDG